MAARVRGKRWRVAPYDERHETGLRRPAQPASGGRARYLRRLRELQLRDLGGFVVELRRLGRERPELVQAKVDGAAETDRELRALERALDERRARRELREPGIGGACPDVRHGARHRATGTARGAGGKLLSERRPQPTGAALRRVRTRQARSADQEWCLECGPRGPCSSARPTGGSPVAVIVAVVVGSCVGLRSLVSLSI